MHSTHATAPTSCHITIRLCAFAARKGETQGPCDGVGLHCFGLKLLGFRGWGTQVRTLCWRRCWASSWAAAFCAARSADWSVATCHVPPRARQCPSAQAGRMLCVALLALALAKPLCKHAVCADMLCALLAWTCCYHLPASCAPATLPSSTCVRQAHKKEGSQKRKPGNAHACAQAAAHSSKRQRVF